MKIAFSVDDLSPLYDFEHLDLLHDTFGLKFDAFIPTNHFGRAALSIKNDWIEELKSRPWIQPNIHGVEHRSPDGSTIEYLNLDYSGFMRSFAASITEFRKVGLAPVGVKAPGWDVNNMNDYLDAARDIGLSYVCLHRPGDSLKYKEINKIKTFGYTCCIHEDFQLSIDSILHSHIHPSQGQNGLTDDLVNHIIKMLAPIQDQIEPVFLKDCL